MYSVRYKFLSAIFVNNLCYRFDGYYLYLKKEFKKKNNRNGTITTIVINKLPGITYANGKGLILIIDLICRDEIYAKDRES